MTEYRYVSVFEARDITEAEAEEREALRTPYRERTPRQEQIVRDWRTAQKVKNEQWYADRGLRPMRLGFFDRT